MSDREQAKKSIVEHVGAIENDNVLRSMIFVMGDYMVSDDGAERASYIMPIIRLLVCNADYKDLECVYSFVHALFAE